jgi:hypothetical protein
MQVNPGLLSLSRVFTGVILALADADPLGVNQNVTFEEVGGLDDRQSFLLP